MKFDYNSEYGPPTGRKTVKVEEDYEEELPKRTRRCCGQKPHKVT
jgi:hypothetical protein